MSSRTAESYSDRPHLLRLVGWAMLVGAILAPVVYRATLPAAQAVRPGEVVIRYMAWGNPQQLDVERDIIDLFNQKCANEGRKLRVELFMPPAGGYAQKLRLMLASDTAPDVMRLDHFDFPSLVPRGYFRDLTDLAAADKTFDAAAFHPAAMRENYYRGRLYGLNTLFGGVICYYNKDLFARAGLADPYVLWKEGRWTWEAFEKSAVALTERASDGKTTRYGFLLPAQGSGGPPVWAWSLWVWRENGRAFSEDGRHCLLGDSAATRGLEEMRDLLYVSRVSPTPGDNSTSVFTFESGKIAMEFNWAGLAPRYRDSIKDFSWDIVPTPSPAGQPYAAVKGNQLVMAATCQHPTEAWEWIRFMTSRDVELRLYGDKLRRNVPTRLSLLRRDPKTGLGGEYLKATARPFQTDILPYVLDNSRELPIDATFPAWAAELQPYLDRLFRNPDISAAQLMPIAAAAVDRAIADEREHLSRYQGER